MISGALITSVSVGRTSATFSALDGWWPLDVNLNKKLFHVPCNHEVCLHLSRTVQREVNYPCSLSEMLIWDYKWGRCLEVCSSISFLCRLWCLSSCYMYADRLVSKRKEGLCSHLAFSQGRHLGAQKHWEALSLLKQLFSFPGLSLAGCYSIKPLCQLSGSVCTVTVEELWYKTWTLKPVPWQQQTSSKLSDRPELHSLKN